MLFKEELQIFSATPVITYKFTRCSFKKNYRFFSATTAEVLAILVLTCCMFGFHRATVIEHAHIWYRDDGALTKVFCEGK